MPARRGLGGWGWLRLAQVKVLGSAAAAQDRRQTCRLGRLDAFDSQHPYVALLEAGDEMRNPVRTEMRRREIECDGMTGKEAFGAIERGVEVHQPVCDRRPRREDEGRIGACPKFQRLTLDDEVRHHPSPIFDDSNWLIISPEMVNDRLKKA